MGPTTTIGVLLMAYGSPDSLDELEPYLLDIRGGRPVSPTLLAEIREHYILIGGRSPLLDLTRAQAAALETELNQRFEGQNLRFRTYIGMRHWRPRIREAVAQIDGDRIERVVALVMAPHSSRLSTGAYFARVGEAMGELDTELNVTRIESWHDHPGLIAALAEKARAALQGFPEAAPYFLFTAHSLPARIRGPDTIEDFKRYPDLEQGDPYEDQLSLTASLLAGRLGLPAGRWGFCYQSAGQSNEAWLGPSIDRVIPDLVQSGHKNLLVVPIGFVCDHVEVLYDIDIAARDLAAAQGARLERSESLNASPTFIAALADLVTSHLPAQVQ